MPRRAKQPAQTSAGQAYGTRQDQEQAMKEMPLPSTPGIPELGGQAPVAQSTTPTAGDAPMPMAPNAPDMPPPEMAALGMEPPSGPFLDAETARPDEPLTHGLPTGAGGGPEVLGPQYVQPAMVDSQGVQTIRAIAAANGNNPGLEALADDLRRRGL